MSALILNSSAEIIPSGEGRFEVRASLFGTKIEATRYQVGLLQQFETAKTIEQCIGDLPFDQEASQDFLESCQKRHLLLCIDKNGVPILPDRTLTLQNFAHVPHYDPAEPSAFTFIGVPFDGYTTGHAGARFGPQSIRAASGGTRYRLDPYRFTPYGFYDYSTGKKLLSEITLCDAGDVFCPPGESAEVFFERVSRVVSDVCRTGSIPLILGGDHSITWPVLRALPHQEFGIIHFDAHTDLGEAMPGSQLHHGSVFTHILEKLEYVEPLLQFGLRGIIDASEHITSDVVSQWGLEQVRLLSLEEMLEQIPPTKPYYMSIDIDVLDPVYAPATGTPVCNGMLPSELKAMVHYFASHREIIGVDVVEVGLSDRPEDTTGGLAAEILLTAADGLVAGLDRKIDTENEQGR